MTPARYEVRLLCDRWRIVDNRRGRRIAKGKSRQPIDRGGWDRGPDGWEAAHRATREANLEAGEFERLREDDALA